MIDEGATEALPIVYFNMKLINITKDMIVTITNDLDDEKIFINTPGANGIYEFEWNKVDLITKFTYVIKASSSTDCFTETLRTGYLVTPKYNYFSRYGICDGISDYKYCSKFITFDVKYSDQMRYIKDYKT